MVGFKKFIIDNSAQIWTLVSVAVGGIVTIYQLLRQNIAKTKDKHKEKIWSKF